MEMQEKESLDLSILMPCLNEEATVGICIREAKTFLETSGLRGEVLVVDNGSSDGSAAVAESCGATVIAEPRRGYGRALRTGIAHSRGSVILMGDCDTTYDFLHLDTMYSLLAEKKYSMVIGNRFAGGMEPGSMPWSHKWGVRMLSFLGRATLGTDVCDFHCGLRGMTRTAAEQLAFSAEGMEFATEMIAEAAKRKLPIGQVPVKLRKCSHSRKSKLRTVRDGFRHLRLIIQFPAEKGRILWKKKSR